MSSSNWLIWKSNKELNCNQKKNGRKQEAYWRSYVVRWRAYIHGTEPLLHYIHHLDFIKATIIWCSICNYINNHFGNAPNRRELRPLHPNPCNSCHILKTSLDQAATRILGLRPFRFLLPSVCQIFLSKSRLYKYQLNNSRCDTLRKIKLNKNENI